MPFTPSHVAAVLPLVRTPLVPSALVAGSMAPDTLYYLPWDTGLGTHDLAAALSTDVVLGALLLAGWHLVLRRPVLASLPAAVRGRLPDAPLVQGTRGRVGRSALLVLSLAVGSVTHVVWDSFTHPGRWGTQVVPWLGEVHGPLPGHQWAQHASTVLGGLAVLWWLASWWRSTPRRPMPVHHRVIAPAWAALGWSAVVATTVVVGLVAAGDQLLGGAADPRGLGFVAATRGISAGAAVAVGLAVVAAWSWRPLRA